MTDQHIQRSRILVIDDEPFFLDLLSDSLSQQYQVSLAKSGKQGLQRAQGAGRPDLILLDVVMPEMDGYQTCQQLKDEASTQDIPVIFLTAQRNLEDELKGFELGAVDYITKPISLPLLLTRINNQLALSQQKIALEHLVIERTTELERTKDAIVYSMGEMAEARDEETGNHLLRTREYVKALARQLSANPNFKAMLNERLIDAFQRAAPLHDIGKIAVPDSILRKQDRLTVEERKIMNNHPDHGRQSIQNAENKIGSTLFIKIAKEIAYCHHEKWDGSGYPQGLTGKQIPLSARLMALADVYDALVSRRCYKPTFTHQQATEMILQQKHKHFDPEITDAFLQIHAIFNDIAQKYKDE